MTRIRQFAKWSLAVAGVSCGLLASARLSEASIIASNATTSITVYGGEANNGLVPYGGYLSYTDLGYAEETTWSIDPLLRFSDGSTAVLSNGSTGGLGSPFDAGGGVIRSETTTGGVTVRADTKLIGSNAQTTFTFTTDTTLDGITFVYYAENDLFSFSNDTATFQGSIAGDNLKLFQYDSGVGGLTVALTAETGPGAVLSLFGAGIWSGWGTSLEGGDLSVLSADGSNFAVLGDLGLAFAFSLTGSSASLIVNYDTQPSPPASVPEPATALLIGTGAIALIGAGASRRRVAGAGAASAKPW